MRSLLIGERTLRQQTLAYYLLAEECEDVGEYYGVGVCGSGGEKMEIPRITVSQHKIMLLGSTLVKHLVTPTTLRDVIDDWILG